MRHNSRNRNQFADPTHVPFLNENYAHRECAKQENKNCEKNSAQNRKGGDKRSENTHSPENHKEYQNIIKIICEKLTKHECFTKLFHKHGKIRK